MILDQIHYVTTYQKGDKVWFRGQFSNEFDQPGVVENVYENDSACLPRYGIRFGNGNFTWAIYDQLAMMEADDGED